MINILYIDDEYHNLKTMEANLRHMYNIHLAQSAAKFKSILKDYDIHVVITDQRMPKVPGLTLLEYVKENYPEITRVMLTAYADAESAIGAINSAEIYRYLEKPTNYEELNEVIKSGYQRHLETKEKVTKKMLIEKLIQINETVKLLFSDK